MNCPFYGRALFGTHFPRENQPPFVLFDQHGNQCAIITGSHSPCRMEIDGEEPNWKTCILVKNMRMEADT